MADVKGTPGKDTYKVRTGEFYYALDGDDVITFEKGQFRRKRSKLEWGISALAWHPTEPVLAIGHEDGRVMLLSLE